MTRGSILEYVKAIRDRYLRSKKKDKGKILDEFIQVTKYHRKAAIRLLVGGNGKYQGKKRGRKKYYGKEVAESLHKIWEASDRLCSKRLKPFIGELIKVMRRHGELVINPGIEEELVRMSPATMDRLLRPWRSQGGRRPFSTTKPGSLLKSSIPIRTFADWTDNKPGFLEIDLVAHCGDSVEGFYLNTLCAVDVASGWSECVEVWGKGQERVGTAIHRLRRRLPFPLLGLDSDNGSEFINQHLYNYCRVEKIAFTRSRSYKKNDSCHVEQKNWSVVRRLVGYDRYSSHAALDRLNLIYAILRQYINFFQPTMKLVSKTRNGAKVHKVYDTAKTPYQRLLESGMLTMEKRTELSATYYGLNPVQLLGFLNGHLERLWKMADRPIHKSKIKEAISVTGNYEATKMVR